MHTLIIYSANVNHDMKEKNRGRKRKKSSKPHINIQVNNMINISGDEHIIYSNVRLSYVLYQVTINEFLRSNAWQINVLRFLITVLLHDVINSTNYCMRSSYTIRFDTVFPYMFIMYIGHLITKWNSSSISWLLQKVQ